ncbi:GntR family transcriptional regulator [Cutibacterium acnes]|uniref:GntR family transcriptional regulator n=1 Tax=Cutibacterium acnes TaxID=1747 RepID=UPI0021B56008|nr:GntR family transcriptional regulator [Cutibacterium acnes]
MLLETNWPIWLYRWLRRRAILQVWLSKLALQVSRQTVAEAFGIVEPAGLPILRAAIAEPLARDGVPTVPQRIAVNTGVC